jgi:hypothetical protein
MAEPLMRHCEVCGEPFEVPTRLDFKGRVSYSPRRTCSQTCAIALQKRSHHGGKRWTAAEEIQLTLLAGTMPLPELKRHFRQWAALTGHPRRSDQAISHHLVALGLSAVPELDCWTLAGLARLLGLKRTRVQQWLARGVVDAPRVGNNRVFRAAALRETAMARPQLFGGADPEGLALVLGDAEWARELLARYPQPPNADRAVVRVTDGRRFRSITVAAHATGCQTRHIRDACDKKHRCRGHYWRYADAC